MCVRLFPTGSSISHVRCSDLIPLALAVIVLCLIEVCELANEYNV